MPAGIGAEKETTDEEANVSHNIHALLIGVDNYSSQEIPSLSGAVADVFSINQFLTGKLATPAKNITILQDAEATHDRILGCIDGLSSSKRINRDDPILIYFAGHGSTITTPPDCLGQLERNQTPQCEGANANLTIFKASVDYRPHWHPVSPATRKGEFILGDAGMLQGITAGSEFDLYDMHQSLSRAGPVGLLKATIVGAVDCVCTMSSSSLVPIPPSSMAVLRKHGLATVGNVLRIHVTIDPIPAFLLEAIQQTQESRISATQSWRIECTTQSETAHIGINCENDQAVFTIHDASILRLSMKKHTRLGFSVPADSSHITRILRAAAHFFWHLRRLNLVSGVDASLSSLVKLHVYRLQEVLLSSNVKKYIPEEPLQDLATGNDGVWSVYAEGLNAHYGVELENTSELDLFLSMFYFDCNTLEISLLANSRAANFETITDAPLKAGKKYALNYHEGNGQLLSFTLPAHQQVDFGYIVVFLSSRQFDLSHIEQNGFGPAAANPSKKWFTRQGQESGFRGLPRSDPHEGNNKASGKEQQRKCGVLTLPVLIESPHTPSARYV
ncbi:hypothetical protein K488DRAFT_89159 [Vararia minispora EC-137]|uniref:Uncharacterized protein n=1 Tax=Vararia minispora EC-137 TaxID=1314806 RepID=A0ACB8QB72_9AGAM|nr:hypothetical protein K488DRAFT_89159 [Vararia minispora EC-137]